MRAFHLFLLLAFSLPVGALAQAKPHNGYWWKDTSDSMRLGYVMGFADAASEARLMYLVLANREKNAALAADMKSMAAGRDYSNIRFGQFVEGMQVFYGDYRNMAIHTDDAMGYVRDSLRGFTDDQLQGELTVLRRMASGPDYDN